MDDIAYWLALQRTPGIGTKTFHKLLDQHGSPRRIIESDFNELTASLVTTNSTTSTQINKQKNLLKKLRKPDWKSVEKDLQWAEQPDNHILTLLDPLYPALLKEIADAPPILYVKGCPDLLQLSQIAMVGSRNPSPSGQETASEFAYALSISGLIVTSGLALGIDGSCHEAALAAKSPTIAVLGTGLDKVYPARHHSLAVRIAENGALVSEYTLGTPPIAANFPKRNRIISGLSVGTIVIEATLKSGSLITARMANEQGREVFAIPGSIRNPASKGCHKLIREGAKLVETTQDILEEITPLCQFNLSEIKKTLSNRNKDLNKGLHKDHTNGSLITTKTQVETQIGGSDKKLQQNEKEYLLHKVGHEPVSIDSMVERTGMSVESISSLLMALEIQGSIVSSNGLYYKVSD